MAQSFPTQRVPEPSEMDDPGTVIRTDLHRSPAGQVVKVEVFGDGSTRLTARHADGRWHHASWEAVGRDDV